MVRRYWSIALTLFAILASCSNSADSNTDNSTKLVYGLTLEVSGFDPHINRSSELGIVLRQVYDTLVYRDLETGDFVAGLATSWEVSDDQLTYTFNLLEGVTFHDGTPFNAQAVGANIDRIFAPETNSQKSLVLLGPLSRYEIVDDFIIRFHLTEPYAPFLDAFSQVYLGIASPKALEEYTTLTYQFHQVGTGPFIFEEFLPGDRILLRRNPNYTWGPEFYQPLSDNAVDVIEYRFFTDAPTRGAVLEANDAQIIGELLPIDARTFANSSAIQLIPVGIAGQPLQYYFNTQNQHTDELAVRQALLYATNRTAIVDSVFQGFSPVAWGPLSSSHPNYHRGLINLYANDLTLAQDLLTSAGYEDTDDDGILDRNGEPLELIVLTPPWGLLPQVSQLLQDQWRAIGVRAIIEPAPGFVSLLEKVQTGNYHLVAFNNFGLDASILNPSFLSDGFDNWTGYSNEELDTLLLSALREPDASTRRQQYRRVQEIIMEQALILPIRDTVNINGTTANINGLRFDPYGWFPLMYNVTVDKG